MCLVRLASISGLIILADGIGAGLFAVTILMGLALGFIRPAALKHVYAHDKNAPAEMARADQLAGLVTLAVLIAGFGAMQIAGMANGILCVGLAGLGLAIGGLATVFFPTARSRTGIT